MDDWEDWTPDGNWVGSGRLDTVDPYLAWAAASGFAHFSPAPEAHPGVRVLFELRHGCTADELQKALQGRISVTPFYLGQPLLHGTGWLDAEGCRRLADPDNPWVVRFELAEPIQSRRRPTQQHAPLSSPRAAARTNSDTLLAVIDDGCPFAHRAFRRGGVSRVLSLWDQDPDPVFGRSELPGSVPPGAGYGREIQRDDIAALLATCDNGNGIDEDLAYELAGYRHMRRRASHGAMVMDQFIGPQRLGDRPGVVADQLSAWPGSGHQPSDTDDLVFVQLPWAVWADPTALALSAAVLDGLHHVLACRGPQVRRVVVNLSCAVHTGPHDGSTLLDRALLELVEFVRGECLLQIIVPAGNSYQSRWHARGTVRSHSPGRLVLRVPPACEAPTFLQVWLAGPQNQSALVEWAVQPARAATAHRIEGAGQVLTGSRGPRAWALRSHSRARGDGGTLLFLVLAAAEGPDLAGSAGDWVVEISVPEGHDPVAVKAYVGCNESAFGEPVRHRAARLVDSLHDPERHLRPASLDVAEVTHDGPVRVLRTQTASAAAACAGVYSTAGMTLRPFGIAADYSADGLLPQRAAAAVSDESRALPGIRGAGNRSACVVRLQGTSFAAPQMARACADGHVGAGPQQWGTSLPAALPILEVSVGVSPSLHGPSARLGSVLLVPRQEPAARTTHPPPVKKPYRRASRQQPT